MKGIGSCKLNMRNGRTLFLHDVLYAPDIRRNLVFVSVLLRLGFTFVMFGTKLLLSLNNVHYGCGYLMNGFIMVDVVDMISNNLASFSLITSSVDANVDIIMWHARLGHIGQHRIARLTKEGLLGQIDRVELPTCECLAGKNGKKTIW